MNSKNPSILHGMVVLWNINRTMPSNSFKLIFLCILVCFFNFATTKAQEADATFIYESCSANGTANGTYEMNLRTLLSSLSSKATAKTFYNNTVVGRNSPNTDTVYGLFMCRGDVPSNLCTQCVVNATERLSSDRECSLSIEGVIWYDECMVRYSNVSFFSTVGKLPGLYMWNMANISSNRESFRNVLSNTIRHTADEAANSSNRYSTKQALLPQSQILYCLAQCTQDLSPQGCTDCLDGAIAAIPICCDGKQGGRVLFPSCNIRYELYPFYRVRDEAPQGLVPETKYRHTDSEYSEDPGYVSHNCSSITGDGAFQSDLRALLSDLSSNATIGDESQLTVGTAYGLSTCRLDIPPRLCGQCVQNATDKIASECRWATEAVIWYNHCWLRYSNLKFFSSMETSPRFQELNITNTNQVNYSVALTLISTELAEMANKTGDSTKRYHTTSLRLNDYQTVYILGQCTLDLSSSDCGGCLSDVIGSAIPWSSLGSVGGRVLYPSCILRFELFQFYDLTPTSTPPRPGFYILISKISQHDSNALFSYTPSKGLSKI